MINNQAWWKTKLIGATGKQPVAGHPCGQKKDLKATEQTIEARKK
jgi:hypothetical protein